jgi:hypothetical protein
VEITPALIKARVMEVRERCFGEPLQEVVHDIIIAALAARYVASLSASSTSAW